MAVSGQNVDVEAALIHAFLSAFLLRPDLSWASNDEVDELGMASWPDSQVDGRDKPGHDGVVRPKLARLIPARRTSLTLPSPRPFEGRFARRRDAGRGAVSPRARLYVSRCTRGGAGAPPGSTTRPRQELADDRSAM
jgi:hypothetical protein